jgi:hypothetical protein
LSSGAVQAASTGTSPTSKPVGNVLGRVELNSDDLAIWVKEVPGLAILFQADHELALGAPS